MARNRFTRFTNSLPVKVQLLCLTTIASAAGAVSVFIATGAAARAFVAFVAIFVPVAALFFVLARNRGL
jgi:hypothetical protein